MKKLITIISLILAAMLLMTCAYAGYTVSLPGWLTGDVDGDNLITNTDLVTLAKHVVGAYALDSAETIRADINSDGAVDNNDVVTLALFTVKRAIPTKYYEVCYAINVDDYSMLVGDADYVFVGTVWAETGVTYEQGGSENDEYPLSIPYTGYEIKVSETIKGSLNPEIELKKDGGLAANGKYYVLNTGDHLPKEGETRIFFAYAQPDGSLVVSGKNSNLPYNSAELEKVKNAAQNPAEIDRVRYKSYYDPAWEMDRTVEPWSRAIDAQVVDYSWNTLRVCVMIDGEPSEKIYTVDTSDCGFLIAIEALRDNYPVIILPSEPFDPSCDTFTADMVMGYRN